MHTFLIVLLVCLIFGHVLGAAIALRLIFDVRELRAWARWILVVLGGPGYWVVVALAAAIGVIFFFRFKLRNGKAGQTSAG